jgi:hypothetical protein
VLEYKNRLKYNFCNDPSQVVPGSLGNLISPDEREPDCHKWILNQIDKHIDPDLFAFDVRNKYIPIYGFVIPTRRSLDAIIKYSPNGLIDFGCGNGYLSFLLRANGLDSITAIDINPPELGENKWWNTRSATDLERRHWTNITQGSYEMITKLSNKSLLLCWPPYNSDMATKAVKAYRGSTLMLWGEEDGCTGEPKNLDKKWELITTTGVAWSNIHDYLRVFKRK